MIESICYNYFTVNIQIKRFWRLLTNAISVPYYDPSEIKWQYSDVEHNVISLMLFKSNIFRTLLTTFAAQSIHHVSNILETEN
jgi:hypothetical protein